MCSCFYTLTTLKEFHQSSVWAIFKNSVVGRLTMHLVDQRLAWPRLCIVPKTFGCKANQIFTSCREDLRARLGSRAAAADAPLFARLEITAEFTAARSVCCGRQASRMLVALDGIPRDSKIFLFAAMRASRSASYAVPAFAAMIHLVTAKLLSDARAGFRYVPEPVLV